MKDFLPANEVESGQLAAGADQNIVRPRRSLVVVGYRLQIIGVTAGGEGIVRLYGRNGTVVSGGIYVDSNDLNYVQDRLRIELAADEALRLANNTNGTVYWAVLFHKGAVR